MKIAALLVTWLLALGQLISIQAQAVLLESEEFKQDAFLAIDHVYNLEYEASLLVFERWIEEEPNHALWKLWEGFPYWWQILSNLPDTSHDDEFIRIMEEADRKADRMLHRNRRHKDALVVKTLANGYLSRLYANRGRWYLSFTHGRTALNVLNVLERTYPDLPDTQFGTGLYLYFTAYVADTNPIVRTVSFMLPAGDRAQGLELLEQAAENSTLTRPEAVYFLGHILLNYENKPDKARGYLLELVERYPQNRVFWRLWNRAR